MLKDRQLLVSPEPPSTLGVVTDATDSAFRCGVLFRGKQYACYSAGKNALAVNDLVSFWEIDGFFFCCKADAGYPTRFKRPMIEWAATHSHNLLLQYCVRKQANIFTYRLGAVEAVASEFSLVVGCWDGVSREMAVEYAGSAKSSTSFSVGEPVVCYRKSTGIYVVIGKLASITITPTSIDFGLVATGASSDAAVVDIVGAGLSENIVAATTPPFQVSLDELAWALAVEVTPSGGQIYLRFAPTASGIASGGVIASSGSFSASAGLSGTGFTPSPGVPVITLSSTFDLASIPLLERIPITIDYANITTPSYITCGANFIYLGETIDGPGDRRDIIPLTLSLIGTGTKTIYMWQISTFGGAPSPQPIFYYANAEAFLPFPGTIRDVYFKHP